MGTPFPGMDPYLERRGLWEQTHLWIVVMAQDVLNAQITPKYRAAIAQRTYTAITDLPVPEEIKERYLEIREVSTDRVITVIELLSPSNKLSREGRDEYERKRLKVLGSLTHLIEIDLLRAGTPPEFRLRQPAASSDYRITISRSERRPYADLHLFGIREPIPDIRIPLKRGEDEPVLPLNRLLHELYDRARYDLVIHYDRPAEPPLNELDAVWVQSIIKP